MDVDHRIIGDSMGPGVFAPYTWGGSGFDPLIWPAAKGHYGALCALECALRGDIFWLHSRKTA